MLEAMKKLAGLLTLAFVLMPAATFAQLQPPPSPWPSGAPHPDFRAMRQMHDQMEQIHRTTRTKMLAALTPQHRRLLANVAGQLAISPKPSRRAAEQQLDAALTAREKQSILAIQKDSIGQIRTVMQRAFPNAPKHRIAENRMRRTPSAGELLLRVATSSERPIPLHYYPMRGEHGHGPGGPPMGPNVIPIPSPTSS